MTNLRHDAINSWIQAKRKRKALLIWKFIRKHLPRIMSTCSILQNREWNSWDNSIWLFTNNNCEATTMFDFSTTQHYETTIRSDFSTTTIVKENKCLTFQQHNTLKRQFGPTFRQQKTTTFLKWQTKTDFSTTTTTRSLKWQNVRPTITIRQRSFFCFCFTKVF